jgi:MFS family permease
MLIPLLMLKENSTKEGTEGLQKREKVPFFKSFAVSFKNPKYIYWLSILFVMNIGLQLFLSGINEFFSTTGVNMTFVMASAFAPIPFTLQIYNKLVKKYGLKVGYQYSLAVFSLGMGLMFLCNGIIPESAMTIFAICCALIVSFGIGTFFSVTYMIPSQLASEANLAGQPCASSMYFAVQGLFEAVSASFASYVLLVFLKEHGGIPYLTCIVALSCMAAFVLAFFMPKSMATLGKRDKASEK